MNSIKFKASLLTKHWTYQTLNECINASVVILPIEKYKLIQRPDVVVVKFCVIIYFFAAREWNDRQTVDGSNSIKIQNYLSRRTYDV